jgi:hypothetical protein
MSAWLPTETMEVKILAPTTGAGFSTGAYAARRPLVACVGACLS